MLKVILNSLNIVKYFKWECEPFSIHLKGFPFLGKQDPRLQGRAPGFRGGGVPGKGQDRNKTRTSQGQDKEKTGTR